MKRIDSARLVGFLGALVIAPSVEARTINVTPADSYALIEGAQAGDEVVIASGTYGYRVHLESRGTPNTPIVIRAADPQNPPVWDLGAVLVEDAPGSYTAGDRGRGCWQFSNAANIQVSGIVIKGCHNTGHNSAGIRYYNGSTGIILRDVVFRDNDNGLTGGTQDSEITVEHSEFDANGSLSASSSAPSHNIYIYGGTFTLRYSYAHDPVQAQNFHIRAKNSVIEYNWFSRAKSYAGDLMTDDDFDGSGTLTQTMTFRGNVIVQGDTQSNTSQIIAVYNDAGVRGLTLNVVATYNTFIGNGGRAGFVHLSNADQTPMHAELSNNIIFGTTRPVYAEDTSATITGSHNWLMSNSDPSGLTASIMGTDPGFSSAASGNYTLAQGSSCINAAAPPTVGVPDREYYENESVSREYRLRVAALDVGAFESTTIGTGIGAFVAAAPYGTGGNTSTTGGSSSVPAGGSMNATGGMYAGGVSAVTGGAENGGNTAGGGTNTSAGSSIESTSASKHDGDCGCRLAPVRPHGAVGSCLWILACVVMSRRRERGRRKS